MYYKLNTISLISHLKSNMLVLFPYLLKHLLIGQSYCDFFKNTNTNNLYFVAIICIDQLKNSEKNNYFASIIFIIYFNTSREIAQEGRVVPVLARK